MAKSYMTGGRPPRVSLLSRLQRLIERTYDLDTLDVDAGAFVVGDAGLEVIYRGRHAEGRNLHAPSGAMLLARTEGGVGNSGWRW